MIDESSPDGAAWPVTWEAHDAEQRRRLAKLSLFEKFEWLEEAQEMVEQLAAARRQEEPNHPPGLQ